MRICWRVISRFHELGDCLEPVQDLGLHAGLAHRDQHQEGRVGVPGALLGGATIVLGLILGKEAGDHQLLLLWCHLKNVHSLHAQFFHQHFIHCMLNSLNSLHAQFAHQHFMLSSQFLKKLFT